MSPGASVAQLVLGIWSWIFLLSDFESLWGLVIFKLPFAQTPLYSVNAILKIIQYPKIWHYTDSRITTPYFNLTWRLWFDPTVWEPLVYQISVEAIPLITEPICLFRAHVDNDMWLTRHIAAVDNLKKNRIGDTSNCVCGIALLCILLSQWNSMSYYTDTKSTKFYAALALACFIEG